MNRFIAALTLTVAIILPVAPAEAKQPREPVRFDLAHAHRADTAVAAVDEHRMIRVRTALIQEAKVRRFAYAYTVAYAVRIEQAKQNAAARARAQAATRPRYQPTAVQSAQYGSGACGGNLPPCSVMMCESGGNIHAQNPSSTASGKWQILNSTWNNYMGYPTAASAPEWVQDQRAAQIYAGGAGRSQWVC